MTYHNLQGEVTVADCRRLGYCVSGLKAFANQNGLDIKELVKKGWPIDRLRELNDLYADAAIKAAMERMNGR